MKHGTVRINIFLSTSRILSSRNPSLARRLLLLIPWSPIQPTIFLPTGKACFLTFWSWMPEVYGIRCSNCRLYCLLIEWISLLWPRPSLTITFKILYCIVMVTISFGRIGVIVVVECFWLSGIRFPVYKGQTWKQNLRCWLLKSN